MPLKVYLTHPISGLAVEQVFQYYDTLTDWCHRIGVTPLSPMSNKDHLRGLTAPLANRDNSLKQSHPVTGDHAIVKRDLWMVSECDIILADLCGATERSIGCVAEIAWGHLLRKHVVTAMEVDNPHQHAFILEMSDVVFGTPVHAQRYLAELAEATISVADLKTTY